MMNPFAYVICIFGRHKWRDTRDARSRWTCEGCGVSTRKIRF
jgi:hypothetical protein